MKEREKLEKLIAQAGELLEKEGMWHTNADNQALEDMVLQARKALEGKGRPPHSYSRAFMKPQRLEEQMQFAAKRYTMAPTYLEHGVWSYYGLEEAIRWYREKPREYRKEEFLLQAKEVLKKNEKRKEGIGAFDQKGIRELKEVLEVLEQSEEKENAGLLVQCWNKLYEVQLSRRYRSDMDSEDRLFLGKEELEKLREQIGEEGFIREQYREIQAKAEELSLEEVQKRYEYLHVPADYEELNKVYDLWSPTPSNINFTVPKDTAFGVLRFILPSCENEEQGLGHVWIDDVQLQAADGEFCFPRNGGFEETGDEEDKPRYWKAEKKSGNPRFLREERPHFRGRERCSVYLENPDKDAEGMWKYEENIPFAAGEIYTLKFSAKIDGKFQKGVLAEILFYDKEGKETGIFQKYFNKKSWIPCGDYNLRMQCDAICYAMTGNEIYARKTKYEILHFMDDFLQGTEYWLRENERPEGSDAYGAVQGGRNLSSIAASYAFIREAQVFTKEEKELFFAMLDYFLRYMMDKRNRSLLSLQAAQAGCSNWQMDMCIGVAFIMFAVPDYPERKAWIVNAVRVIKGMLVCTVNEDGSWPESLRYHHAALERLAQFASVLYRQTGENWFQDKLLKGMFTYSADMQTPAYAYFGNRIGTPPFGDHALSGGAEYACQGLYCKIIAKEDKRLADKMYTVWCKAGKPVKKLWGEGITLENLLYPWNEYQTDPDFRLQLGTETGYPQSGIYLFRNVYEEGKESFSAIMSSPKPIGHGHRDQGSFIIYKDNVPVIMDSGMEGYFDASTQWHLCSYSHAVMQFGAEPLPEDTEEEGTINLSPGLYSRKRGWWDTPRQSRVKKVFTGEKEEYVVIEIDNPGGKGIQTRIFYHDRIKDIYVVQDQVTDFDGQLLFSLPTVMTENQIEGNVIRGKGTFGVNLQTVFLTKTERIWVETGRSTDFFPHEGGLPMLSYIRAQAKDGFCVVLCPGDGNVIKEAAITEEGCIRISYESGEEGKITLPKNESVF